MLLKLNVFYCPLLLSYIGLPFVLTTEQMRSFVLIFDIDSLSLLETCPRFAGDTCSRTLHEGPQSRLREPLNQVKFIAEMNKLLFYLYLFFFLPPVFFSVEDLYCCSVLCLLVVELASLSLLGLPLCSKDTEKCKRHVTYDGLHTFNFSKLLCPVTANQL